MNKTTAAQDYTKLVERLATLKEKRAVLVAEEQRKAVQRKDLEMQLTAVGVNVKDLAGEKQRLETEAAEAYSKALAAVDAFEQALQRASGQDIQEVIPQGADAPEDEEDLDLS